MADWTDSYITARRASSTTLTATTTAAKVKGRTAPSSNRRSSATIKDNTNRTKEAAMPTVTRSKVNTGTKPATAKKTTTARTASKPAASKPTTSVKPTQLDGAGVHEESVELVLVGKPSGRGGYKYDDSNVIGTDKDVKLGVTTVYLSQHTIATAFNGKAPKTLTIA